MTNPGIALLWWIVWIGIPAVSMADMVPQLWYFPAPPKLQPCVRSPTLAVVSTL